MPGIIIDTIILVILACIAFDVISWTWGKYCAK